MLEYFVFVSVNWFLHKEEREMMESVMLFVLGFSCVSSIYEISKTSKSSKSEKVKKAAEKVIGRK